jgi:hypothetical protein
MRGEVLRQRLELIQRRPRAVRAVVQLINSDCKEAYQNTVRVDGIIWTTKGHCPNSISSH